MAFSALAAIKSAKDDQKYIESAAEVIRSNTFTDNLSEAFTLVPNIKGRQQIVVASDIEKITTAEEGCTVTPISKDIPGYQNQWDPKRVEVVYRLCYKDFDATFLQWGLANGYDVHNLDQADFFQFITSFVSDGIKKDFNRLVLMGDADVTAQGALKVAGDSDYYEIINKGIVPRLEEIKASGLFNDQFTTIAQNEAAGAQNTWADGDARAILEGLIDASEFDYMSSQFLTNGKFARAYQKEVFMNPNAYALDSTRNAIVNGTPGLNYEGLSIVQTRDYDRHRKNDFDGIFVGAGAGDTHLPHFVLNTPKSNILVGVDSEAALSDLRIEMPGGADEYIYFKANYMLDVHIADPMKMTAAF